MATKLLREISRETISRNGRPLIVSLCPGDIISFREKGRRVRFECTIGHALQLAKLFTVEKIYKEKMAVYNSQKKLGRKVKRPKKANLFLSKIYYQATK